MSSEQKFIYATEVLMITLCGMIIASGIINMEQYQRVATVKGTGDEVQKNMDYQTMANTWYGIDTAIGSVLGALILAMMTYQVGNNTELGKGFFSSKILTYIFSFVAYAVIIMNSAFGLNVYNKTAKWKAKGACPDTTLPPQKLRQKAMMAARARLTGEPTPEDEAQKYAEGVNKTNIAFITISTVFFAVFIVSLGYDAAKKRGMVGGMNSEFFVY